MAKRILIFSLAYYPSHVSGAEAALKEITDRITPEDIEFHMVTLLFDTGAPREEQVGNVHVHRVGVGGAYLSKILFPLSAALRAHTLHKTLHFDAIWAMMTYMLFPTMLATRLGVRAPHLVTLQDGDPYEKVFGRTRIRPFLGLIDEGFRTAKVIQVISAYLATWPPLRGSKSPIVLVHNGANPRDLKQSVSPEDIRGVQEKYGKKEGDVWLVNTARLVHQKGNDDTIRALSGLPERVKLVLVGDGEDDAMLKALAKELGLEKRVVFTGAVDRSEVSNYRKASDIFVGPSRSEGLGNAFLSAMASHLPVVTTQEGGLAEFVFGAGETHPQTAWVVRKDTPEDITNAVEDILAHPEKVKEVTDTARKMVEENYDWDAIAKQMRERVFAKVLAESLPHVR
jgi:glycosyltransferase involved in cell wall biosynthesis